jgi:NadR type nicotinamide-nucleotide adenylyltransferase
LIKKIVLFGSESTGKTTLAEALAKHYQTVWVPEYAREYLDNERIVVHLEDVMPIAYGQIRLEENIVPGANQFLFCDTNIIETKVYSEAYFGQVPEELEPLIQTRHYDFYLLTNLDVPWTPDHIRDRPHLRNEMHELFRKELIERNLPYVEITGTEEIRFRNAISAIEKYFQTVAEH